jgi:hypothetical protein
LEDELNTFSKKHLAAAAEITSLRKLHWKKRFQDCSKQFWREHSEKPTYRSGHIEMAADCRDREGFPFSVEFECRG